MIELLKSAGYFCCLFGVILCQKPGAKCSIADTAAGVYPWAQQKSEMIRSWRTVEAA